MFQRTDYGADRAEGYRLVIRQLEALVEGEPEPIANLANASALLAQFLPEVNWVGFYLAKGDALVLGPFQGLPACTRIPLGRGVCGTAAQAKITIRVPDVAQFPGHIACDAASQSELVIPLLKGKELLGVLDLDSPQPDRFDSLDQTSLEAFVEVLLRYL